MPIIGTVSSSFKAKAVVTGGTLITSDPTYFYRRFTSNDTLAISGLSLTVDYLIVSGGGGANVGTSGGGGAGGVITGAGTSISP